MKRLSAALLCVLVAVPALAQQKMEKVVASWLLLNPDLAGEEGAN